MRLRVPLWVAAGAAVAAVAVVGLAVYFVVVGLDEADKLASVVGLFVALVGIGLAVYGMAGARRGGPSDGGAGSQDDPERSGGVHLRAEASGEGRVYQAGRDQTINDR
jgi:hypothetical protein